MALQKGNYKLVGHADYNAQITDFELFDLQADPYEQHNIVGEQPETAKSLKLLMDQHYNELVQSENLTSPHRIPIGTTHENPVFLNRNDASGERGIWAQEEIFGKWAVDINEGRYNIKFKFVMPLQEEGQMVLETGTIVNQFKSTGKDQDVLEMKNVYLPNLTGDLIPFYQTKSRRIFPFWVAIEKL